MFARFLAALGLCASLVGPAHAADGPDPDDPHGNDSDLYTDTAKVHGLDVMVRVRHPDADIARKALKDALDEARRVYAKLDANLRNSELGGVNQVGGREEVIVSRETFTVLEHALKVCRTSGGAFDPTVKSFDYLWKLDRKPFVVPLPDEVAARVPLTGCKHLILKPNRAVRIGSPQVRLTVTELLAGHALERMAAAIDRNKIAQFKLAVGRDQYIRGANGTRHWYTYVGHPAAPARTMVQVYVNSHAIATRAVTERAVHHRGKTYHDVLDPRSGQPVRGVLQATVIATDAILADALSYALLTLGPKKGLALIAGLGKPIEAMILTADGTLHATSGMRGIAPKLPSKVPPTLKAR